MTVFGVSSQVRTSLGLQGNFGLSRSIKVDVVGFRLVKTLLGGLVGGPCVVTTKCGLDVNLEFRFFNC